MIRQDPHSASSLLRTSVAMGPQGWDDQSDAARLPDEPVQANAANDHSGVSAAEGVVA